MYQNLVFGLVPDNSTVDSCYNVPLGKQEKVRYNEMFIIKRCFY